MTAKTETLVWETDLPLFSRRMLVQWSLAMLATAVVMFVILGTVFAAQGEWDAMPPMLAMIGAVTGGLWLLGLIIMAVLFRGKYRVRYTLSNTGIVCETLDKVAKKTNRAAIVVGVLARSPQAVGAGLIGISRELEEVRWSGAFRAVPHPGENVIMLRNAWRSLLWVQCTPDNYAQVAAAIDTHMKRRHTAGRVSGKSPVPAYLGRSLLAVTACLPLFPLAEVFDTGLFLPIFILCFALAMIWLINLFGWVVLSGLGLQILLVILAQFEERQSFFNPGEIYKAYEVLGGDDFSLFLVAGIGIAILIWLSLGALRGRWLAALIADHTDMGNA
jgi:hypothetical protein